MPATPVARCPVPDPTVPQRTLWSIRICAPRRSRVERTRGCIHRNGRQKRRCDERIEGARPSGRQKGWALFRAGSHCVRGLGCNSLPGHGLLVPAPLFTILTPSSPCHHCPPPGVVPVPSQRFSLLSIEPFANSNAPELAAYFCFVRVLTLSPFFSWLKPRFAPPGVWIRVPRAALELLFVVCLHKFCGVILQRFLWFSSV